MSVYIDIEKKLGAFDLKVKLEAGDETLTLLGGSGCGKSMTLKCIAGIERPDRGRIVVDGEVLFDSEKGIDLPPQKRRTGLLFQNYALFPQMTVKQNLLAGARREQNAEKRIREVERYLKDFGIEELQDRYPSQISGGQQQRVALARILVSAPRILLLDEPFSALDAHLRFQLEREMRSVIKRFGKTVVFVSHDRDEVFRISDKIALMEDGKITAFGTRSQVFHDPRTVMGARLTGCKNISELVRGSDPRTAYAKDWGLDLSFSEPIPDGIAYAGIRMHDIHSAAELQDAPSFPDEDVNNRLIEADSEPIEDTNGRLIGAGSGQNDVSGTAAICQCRVAEEVEDPFSTTIMLRPVDAPEDSIPIGWTLPKKKWAAFRQPIVTIRLSEDAILLLRP